MAIPTRTDALPQSGRTLRRRPIVLARIPHAITNDVRAALPLADEGNAALAAAEEPPARSLFVDPEHQAGHSASSPPREETGEHFRTRRRRRKRTSESQGKQLWETRSDDSAGQTNQSTLQYEETGEPSQSRRRKRRRTSESEGGDARKTRSRQPSEQKKTNPFGQTKQSKPLASGLYQLQLQLAPYAGSIVALALIASASLLYWMIVSPTQLPTDEIGASQNGFEANTVELPNFVPQVSSFKPENEGALDSEFTIDGLPRFGTEFETEQFVVDTSKATVEQAETALSSEGALTLSIEDPMPDRSVIETTTKQLALDNSVQTAVQPAAPAYPTTNYPTSLDFSKIAVEETQVGPANSKPAYEVGRRPLSHVLTPTKR